MREKQKSMLALVIITFFVATAMFLPGLVHAGELDPTAPPGPTMKTLDQVEPRIPISSLPFTISQSGSYYLTGDLIASGTGITVNSNDVTIDLMGYTISGGSGFGIYMNGRSNVEIRNGTIRDFASSGIYEGSTFGEGHRFINVRVISNGSYGIYLNSKANLIKDSTAVGNGSTGIYAYRGSTVIHNTAYDNGGTGITAGDGSTVTNNTAYNNGNTGIYTGGGSTVTGNTARYNQNYGIYVSNGLADGNTATLNNQSGGYVNLYCLGCTPGTNHAPAP